MVSWAYRVRKAAREDFAVLDEHDRLDFANLLQLLRLTLLVALLLMLLSDGRYGAIRISASTRCTPRKPPPLPNIARSRRVLTLVTVGQF